MAIANGVPKERELTIHQRNLVDTCFEEGQYEAAISVLDEIRSRNFKPFPAHIRQCIFIALYPPPSLEDQLEEEALRLEPGSPSKLLARRHKSSLTPSPKASTAAQDLLMKYALVNTPEVLACALPSFPEDHRLPHDNRVEEEDSYIAKQALRVRNARCCWEILKEGFIPRGDSDVMSSPRKAKATRRSTRRRNDDDEDVDDAWADEDAATPAPVSDHAWSVLDWIITLFESNEAAVEQTGQVRYSPLLLSQIPPSRPDSSPRWDVKMALDVAFHALEQEAQEQQSLGVRLLTLLINLTSTTLVDFPMFLNTVSNSVSSLTIDALSSLLSSLPATRTVAQFKIVLSRHALAGPQASAGKTRPQPQARARAQPRRRARATDTAADDVGASMDVDGVAPSEHPEDTAAPEEPSIARTFPTITSSDVLALLARPSKTGSTSVARTLLFKSELVSSYALLQMHTGENDRDAGWQGILRDAGWQGILRDGTLQRTVEDMFDSAGRAAGATDAQARDDIRAQKAALLACISMW